MSCAVALVPTIASKTNKCVLYLVPLSAVNSTVASIVQDRFYNSSLQK